MKHFKAMCILIGVLVCASAMAGAEAANWEGFSSDGWHRVNGDCDCIICQSKSDSDTDVSEDWDNICDESQCPTEAPMADSLPAETDIPCEPEPSAPPAETDAPESTPAVTEQPTATNDSTCTLRPADRPCATLQPCDDWFTRPGKPCRPHQTHRPRPTYAPTEQPDQPAYAPTEQPDQPTYAPTEQPDQPTYTPTAQPTYMPTFAPTYAPTNAPSDSGSTSAELAQEVLDILNRERANAGLNQLVMDDELTRAACVRSRELVSTFSHTRPDGSSCFTVSDKAFAENIAKGQNSAARVTAAWLSSDGHRRNIMNANYASTGICAYQLNGVIYWTQLFGR